MIEFYPQIKQFHIFVALLSGSIFALRGAFALADVDPDVILNAEMGIAKDYPTQFTPVTTPELGKGPALAAMASVPSLGRALRLRATRTSTTVSNCSTVATSSGKSRDGNFLSTLLNSSISFVSSVSIRTWSFATVHMDAAECSNSVETSLPALSGKNQIAD